MQYRPSVYMPRPASQTIQDAKLLHHLPPRPILVDRWTTETRRSYTPPIRSGFEIYAPSSVVAPPEKTAQVLSNEFECQCDATDARSMQRPNSGDTRATATQTRRPFTIYHTPSTHSVVPQTHTLQPQKNKKIEQRTKHTRQSHRREVSDSACQTDVDPVTAALRAGLVLARADGGGLGGPRPALLNTTGLVYCLRCRRVLTCGVSQCHVCRSALVPLVALMPSAESVSTRTDTIAAPLARPSETLVLSHQTSQCACVDGRNMRVASTSPSSQLFRLSAAECLRWCD